MSSISIFAPFPEGSSAFNNAALTWPGVGPAAGIGPISLEVACALPALLDAVTSTRTALPTSAAVNTSELAVAPAIFEHPGVHSCHW